MTTLALSRERSPTTTALRVLAFMMVAQTVVRAQAVTPVRVHGLAFDSLHLAPLKGATVMVSGSSRSATTDDRGRFELDSVAPGVLTFTVFHAQLDSIGLGALSARVTVGDGREEVRLATPSFATMWRAACGVNHTPGDSGFVYGSIRDAVTQRPVASAIVDVSWVDVRIDSARHMQETRQRKQARSDVSGTYGVCAVPMSTTLRIQAVDSSRSSGAIELFGDGTRVRRRDLSLGPSDSSANATRGTITGMVTTSEGSPFPGARITMPRMPEVRTGTDGRFILRDVPVGTREITVLAVGITPIAMSVDVPPGDTAVVSAALKKAQTLDVVRVTANQRRLITSLEERRRSGWGYMLDSSALGAMGTLRAGFASIPSVQVVRARSSSLRYVITLPAGAGRCMGNLWLDGVRRGADEFAYDLLTDMNPDDIAVMEVYARASTVPAELTTPKSTCGAVVVWTKWKLGR
jgi:hypothetical protein